MFPFFHSLFAVNKQNLKFSNEITPNHINPSTFRRESFYLIFGLTETTKTKQELWHYRKKIIQQLEYHIFVFTPQRRNKIVKTMSLFCLDNTGASNNLNVTMNTHIYINIGQLFRISGEFIWRFKTNRDKKKYNLKHKNNKKMCVSLVTCCCMICYH